MKTLVRTGAVVVSDSSSGQTTTCALRNKSHFKTVFRKLAMARHAIPVCYTEIMLARIVRSDFDARFRHSYIYSSRVKPKQSF